MIVLEVSISVIEICCEVTKKSQQTVPNLVPIIKHALTH